MKRILIDISSLFLFSLITYRIALSANQGVVITNHPLATQAGIEILEQGGNAVDAAVAVMFALSVVEPWASGMGGGGFMLIKIQKDPLSTIIDYREQAPLEARPRLFYREAEYFKYYAYTGYRSICVPGMIAGAEMALRQYGTMKPGQVMAPAKKLAQEGFPVSNYFHKLTSRYYDLIERNRATSAVFFPDWVPLNEGDICKRDDLVLTFTRLSNKGLSEFYQGQMAEEMVEDIRINNGLLTIEDFKSYVPYVRQPLAESYRDYEIVTIPSPSSGGVALIQLLKILEGFDLKQLGYNSGDYIHIFVEALKNVLKDREKYSRDTHSNVNQFLSEQYCSTIRTKIDTHHIQLVNFEPLALKFESENASSVSIIDQSGNVVSLTQTINFYFGSGITHPKYGILFNNGLFNFSQDSSNINAIAPEKRSASSMAPTIVLKNGAPFLILGASGASRTITTLAQIIIGVIDFDMSIEAAIDAPRIHFEDDAIQLETRIESEAIERLKKLGHKINLTTDYNPYFGAAQGILVDPATGNLAGAADRRGEGKAAIK